MTVPRDFSLDYVLAPITPAEFLETTWGRRPLYIPGEPAKYENFFSFVELEAALQADRARFSVRAGFKDAAGEHGEMTASAAQFRNLLAAGMTLFVTDSNPARTKLGRLIRRLRTELGLVSKIDGAYFASQRNSGYGLHFDSVDVLSLQLEGVKRWSISDQPALESPLDTCIPTIRQQTDGIHGFDEGALREIVMRPGDSLYLPAGTWHRPSSEDRSLHVSIAFFKTDPISLLTPLVMPALRDMPAWRRFPGLLGTHGPPLDARHAVASQLIERAKELQAALGALTETQLLASWRSYVDQTGSPPMKTGNEPSAPRLDDETLSFVAKDGFTFAVDPARDSGENLVIHQDAKILLLPVLALGWVRKLADQSRFVARQSSTWDTQISSDTARVWLGDLVRAGVLQVDLTRSH